MVVKGRKEGGGRRITEQERWGAGEKNTRQLGRKTERGAQADLPVGTETERRS